MRATFIVQAAALAATTVYAQRAGSEDGPNNSTTPTDDEDGHVVHCKDPGEIIALGFMSGIHGASSDFAVGDPGERVSFHDV